MKTIKQMSCLRSKCCQKQNCLLIIFLLLASISRKWWSEMETISSCLAHFQRDSTSNIWLPAFFSGHLSGCSPPTALCPLVVIQCQKAKETHRSNSSLMPLSWPLPFLDFLLFSWRITLALGWLAWLEGWVLPRSTQPCSYWSCHQQQHWSNECFITETALTEPNAFKTKCFREILVIQLDYRQSQEHHRSLTAHVLI